ncbi:hypothetical protein E3E31_12330, partial [Thermococcus sp. M39]
MRVGIVAGNIDNRVTGIDNYSYNLIKNLFPLMATQDIEIIVIHPEDKILQEIMDSMKYNGKSFQYVVKIPKLPFDPQKRLSKFVRKLFIIPTHSKKLRLDLVHDVYLGLFFFYPQKTKKIITIYDLVPIKFPQTHRGDTILAHKY